MKKKHLLHLALLVVGLFGVQRSVFAQTPTPTPASLLTAEVEIDAERRAREVLAAPRQTRDLILNQLQDAVQRLWESPDPQGVLDEIGTEGKALFQLNSEFSTLLAAMLTQEGDIEGLTRLQTILGKIPPCTIHQDGRVTIIQPTPTPE